MTIIWIALILLVLFLVLVGAQWALTPPARPDDHYTRYARMIREAPIPTPNCTRLFTVDKAGLWDD